jgi:hypothetical protein
MTEPLTRQGRIVRQWYLNPYLLLEAGENAIELVVSERDRSPAHQRGHRQHEADAPEPDSYETAMREARAWRAAVWPHNARGFPAHQRARAHLELGLAGMARPTAGQVTEFLRDFSSQSDDNPDMGNFAGWWAGTNYPG